MELVTGDARFHTWAVASRLLDAAGEFRWRDALPSPRVHPDVS